MPFCYYQSNIEVTVWLCFVLVTFSGAFYFVPFMLICSRVWMVWSRTQTLRRWFIYCLNLWSLWWMLAVILWVVCLSLPAMLSCRCSLPKPFSCLATVWYRENVSSGYHLAMLGQRVCKLLFYLDILAFIATLVGCVNNWNYKKSAEQYPNSPKAYWNCLTVNGDYQKVMVK